MNAPVKLTDAAVVRFPLSDDEAFTWLSSRDGIRITLAELARHWGWNRSKVLRRLRRWETQGSLRRTIRSDGRSAITISAQENSVLPQGSPPAVALETVEDQRRAVSHTPVAGSDYGRAGTGGVLIVLAFILAGVGLAINASFAGSLGKTAQAAILLAALGIVADALALVLPTVAWQLWRDRRRSVAAIAWVTWIITLCIALMAAIGFAATNIADTVASRNRVIVEHEQLGERIERLRTERRSIDEQRAAAIIEAQIQRAQPGAQAVWKATSGCHDVTLPKSGEACAEVLKLRQALGAAQRRDFLERELKEAEAQLRNLPALATADPQAETTAKLVGWLTRGVVTSSPKDVHLVRIMGIMVLPQLAGLVLMLGIALWQSGKRGTA